MNTFIDFSLAIIIVLLIGFSFCLVPLLIAVIPLVIAVVLTLYFLNRPRIYMTDSLIPQFVEYMPEEKEEGILYLYIS